MNIVIGIAIGLVLGWTVTPERALKGIKAASQWIADRFKKKPNA